MTDPHNVASNCDPQALVIRRDQGWSPDQLERRAEFEAKAEAENKPLWVVLALDRREDGLRVATAEENLWELKLELWLHNEAEAAIADHEANLEHNKAEEKKVKDSLGKNSQHQKTKC